MLYLEASTKKSAPDARNILFIPIFHVFLLQVVFLAVRHYSHLLLKEGAMKRKAGELNILSRSLSGLVVTKLFLVHDDSLKKKGYCLFITAWSKGIDVTKDGSKRMTKQELHKTKLANRVIWMADVSQVTQKISTGTN